MKTLPQILLVTLFLNSGIRAEGPGLGPDKLYARGPVILLRLTEEQKVFLAKDWATPLEVARQNEFTKVPFEITIVYDRKTDSLLWRFSRPAGDEFFTFDPTPRTQGLHFHHLDVATHDGGIVRQYLSRMII